MFVPYTRPQTVPHSKEEKSAFTCFLFLFNNQLHISAIKVDDKPVLYDNTSDRKEHWESLRDDFENIKKELIDSFDLGWKGNVKARLHSEKLDNKYRVRNEKERIFRAQIETYNYYRDKLDVIAEEL